MTSWTAGCGGAAEVPALPASARKQTMRLWQIVQRLNRDYNIGLTLPNPDVLPRLVDEEYRRCDQIRNRLAYLIERRDGLLERALASFVHEAKAEGEKWVFVSSDLGSGPRDPPKAATAGQQFRLQEVLLQLLDRYAPPTTPLLDNFSQPPADQARCARATQTTSTAYVARTIHFYTDLDVVSNPEMDTPSRKRPSDDEELSPSENVSKKRRGRSRPAPPLAPKVVSVLDKVPSRRRLVSDSNSNSSNASLKTAFENHVESDGEIGDDESQEVSRPSRKPHSPAPSQSQTGAAKNKLAANAGPSQHEAEPSIPMKQESTRIELSLISQRFNQRPQRRQSQRKSAARPTGVTAPRSSGQPQGKVAMQSRESVETNGAMAFRSIHEDGHDVLILDESDEDTSRPSAVPVNRTPNKTRHAVLPPSTPATPPAAVQAAAAPPPISSTTCYIPPPATPRSVAPAHSSAASVRPKAPGRPLATPHQPPITPVRPQVAPAPPITPSSLMSRLELSTPITHNSPRAALDQRLRSVWPKFPQWLRGAPIAVAWEMMRIGVHCGVDLSTLDIQYNPQWATPHGVDKMRADLKEYDANNSLMEGDDALANLRFRSFPEKPAPDAFAAGLSMHESRGNIAVMVASLSYSDKITGPLYRVDMQPMKLEDGCRLSRRFGPDRFLELLFPIPTIADIPPHARFADADKGILDWLINTRHSLVGREWRVFFTKDTGFRRQRSETLTAQEPKKVSAHRVHLFAESGHNFQPAPNDTDFVVSPDETAEYRTEFKVSQMLDWLLQLRMNTDQPVFKLFSRIQLGLTKTIPTVTFLPGQLMAQKEDVLSPTGKVMNDGIARMSLGVAKRIRDVMGLSDTPSAIQGRLGSAKGMWIRDLEDWDEDNIWIETFPSQRKWVCNWDDVFHRTLEVKAIPSELKSAALNHQFLPVLEDRAIDKAKMRITLGERLREDLKGDFEAMNNAFTAPIHFKQWIGQQFSTRKRRVTRGYVPMLGGMPESKEEELNMLLDGGFDPKKQRYMAQIAYDLMRQKCDDLKSKMRIKVGCSAYIYMCVDFSETLEEGEVHLGFSNKFCAEGEDQSFTLLTNRDILVARAPAHFPSDVQKVRAVFRPELHSLKDVIIFSSKGDVPLADKLSGGDYDGDMAWVCWDPDFVSNFQNAKVPEQPDLSNYLKKDKTSFQALFKQQTPSEFSRHMPKGEVSLDVAVNRMMNKSFKFAMVPAQLGICTNYKEKLCYRNNSVANPDAILLSALVGMLVDQPKQGLLFDGKAWNRLRNDRGWPTMLPDVNYKSDNNPFLGASSQIPDEQLHIIDYLKFRVGMPAIEKYLGDLSKKTSDSNPSGETSHYYDEDLVSLHHTFTELSTNSNSVKSLLAALKQELCHLRDQWAINVTSRGKSNRTSKPAETYSAGVNKVYAQYQAITLESLGVKLTPQTAFLLSGTTFHTNPEETSQFALLKASTLFRYNYDRNGRFCFMMAGRQLAHLKALKTNGGGLGSLATVVPLMYSALSTDAKFIKQYLARTAAASGRVIDEEEQGENGEYDDY